MSYVRSFHKNPVWYPLSQLDDVVIRSSLVALQALPPFLKDEGKIYLDTSTSRLYRYDVDTETFIYLLEGLNDLVTQLTETGLVVIDGTKTQMTKILECTTDLGTTGDISCRHARTTGNYYATGGIELGWNADKTGNPLQSMIFHKGWSGGLDMVGASGDGSNRLVVIWDHLQTTNVSCAWLSTNNGNIVMGTGDLSCDSITCNSINGRATTNFNPMRRYVLAFAGDNTSTGRTLTKATGETVASVMVTSNGGVITHAMTITGLATNTITFSPTTGVWDTAVDFEISMLVI